MKRTIGPGHSQPGWSAVMGNCGLQVISWGGGGPRPPGESWRQGSKSTSPRPSSGPGHNQPVQRCDIDFHGRHDSHHFAAGGHAWRDGAFRTRPVRDVAHPVAKRILVGARPTINPGRDGAVDERFADFPVHDANARSTAYEDEK